jgi:hypothetical protein
MSGFINSPFGEIRYFNTDDAKTILRAVNKIYRMVEIRTVQSSEQQFATPLKASSVTRQLLAEGARQGLFYFSSGFKDIYTKGIPLDVPIAAAGWHRDFFKELVGQGVLSGDNYEDYPRGFTVYDGDDNVFMLLAGAWLTDEHACKVCKAFGFDAGRFVYAIPPSIGDLYNAYVEGPHRCKPLPFLSDVEIR